MTNTLLKTAIQISSHIANFYKYPLYCSAVDVYIRKSHNTKFYFDDIQTSWLILHCEADMEKKDILTLLGSLPPKNDTWIGLDKSNFGFSHHSSHNQEIDSSGTLGKPALESHDPDKTDMHNDERFCVPESEFRRLRSIIEKSKGGSILVTGYRGTGKSSLVNYTISQIIKDGKKSHHLDPRGQSFYVPIRINLSTSRDPMALVMMMIKELAECSRTGRFDGNEAERIEHTYDRFVKIEKDMQTMGHEVSPTFSASFPMGLFGVSVTEKHSEVNAVSYEYRGYTLHEAQQDLILCIRKLYDRDYKLIFIFDEIDKLVPDSPEDTPSHKIASTKLKEIKTIVSSLKFLLSEANAFHIFIAGKIVDDSWQEDQNKGEGIFESIFVQNIYVPSTLTSRLKAPQLHPNNSEKNGISTISLYKHALAAVGIYPGHWTYNTGLLVLPHFSINELYRLVLRCKDSYVSQNITTRDDENIDTLIGELEKLLDKEADEQTKSACTEKHARRIRYFLRYLTYRGRGIPRKILREFYGMIRDRDDYEKDEEYWEKRGKVKYIVHLKSDLRKKLKFFADIVMVLESRRDFFEQLDDKACVAVFHFIDYIFKFYNKGFSWKDIENANFMTHREELYPSRRLMEYILNLFEDRFIMRLDPRKHEYQFLPRVKSDLEYLFMTFGDEQMELRFTQTDVSHEIQLLRDTISRVEQLPVKERLETIHVQYRLGYLYELLENHETAKLEYEKALRWVQVFMEDNQVSQLNHAAVSHIQVVRLNQIVSVAVDIIGRLACIHQLDYEHEEAYQCYQIALGYVEAANTYSVYSQQQITYDVFRGCSTFSPILGEVEPLKKRIHSPVSFVGDFQAIMELMLPGDEKDQLGYLLKAISGNGTSSSEKDGGIQTQNTGPIRNQLEPIRALDMLRGISLVAEKLWHRVTANLYLLVGLDYAIRKNDDVAILRQLIFIAQIMVRRRDFGLALMFYFLALERLYSAAASELKRPCFSSIYKGQIYESVGDVFVACSNANKDLNKRTKKSSNQETKQDLLKRTLKHLGIEYQKLDIEHKCLNGTLPNLDEPEAWYGIAAEQYKIGGRKRYRFDVLVKRLRCRLWNLEESPRGTDTSEWNKLSLSYRLDSKNLSEIAVRLIDNLIFKEVESFFEKDVFYWDIEFERFVILTIHEWMSDNENSLEHKFKRIKLRRIKSHRTKSKKAKAEAEKTEAEKIKAEKAKEAKEENDKADSIKDSIIDDAFEFVRNKFRTARDKEIESIAKKEQRNIQRDTDQRLSTIDPQSFSDLFSSIGELASKTTRKQENQVCSLLVSKDSVDRRKKIIIVIIKERLFKQYEKKRERKLYDATKQIVEEIISKAENSDSFLNLRDLLKQIPSVQPSRFNCLSRKFVSAASHVSIRKKSNATFCSSVAKKLHFSPVDLKKGITRVLDAEQIEEFWSDSRECSAIVVAPSDVPHFVDMKISDRRRLAELICLWGKFYAVMAQTKLFEPFVSSRFILRDYLKQVMALKFETEIGEENEDLDKYCTKKDYAKNRQHPLWRYDKSSNPPLNVKKVTNQLSSDEQGDDEQRKIQCQNASFYAEMLYLISNEYFLETIEDSQSIEASTCLGELYLFLLQDCDNGEDSKTRKGTLWIASYRYFNQALKTLLGKKQPTRHNFLRIRHICIHFLQLFKDPVYEGFCQWAHDTELSALESRFSKHRLSLKRDSMERLLSKMENELKESERQNFRLPISFNPIQFSVLDRETHYDVCVMARNNSDLAED
ncbi:MAG: ATP-binding protein [Deltaproteobacteria bacterium]|nr:ATP-binding protein [Deltaproteobacteria bacterium]